MNDAASLLDVQTLVAPLGVRFWDAVSGRVIGDGLSVIAYPVLPGMSREQDARGTQAYTNRSGVYAWRNLPGLRDFAYGAGDEAFLAQTVDATSSPVPTRPFIVEVVDTLHRFQPFAFPVEAPLRGLLTWTCEQDASPPAAASTMIPLFSAPTRAPAGGLAVARATLWDATNNLPAAWAMLAASIGGKQVARGFAGADGQVALFFPLPVPGVQAFDPSGTPLRNGMNTALAAQEWRVQLQAWYAPTLPAPAIPELCATLKQAPATLWSDAAGASPLLEVTLKFGRELVVRSDNATLRSVLLISPAA
ncbi:MAG: hypothetical protein ACRDIV_22150 [Ktedonobacteraceae bacterium]